MHPRHPRRRREPKSGLIDDILIARYGQKAVAAWATTEPISK
jgi:hypothetical protein